MQQCKTIIFTMHQCKTIFNTMQQCKTIFNTMQPCKAIFNTLQPCKTIFNAMQQCKTLCNTLQQSATVKLCSVPAPKPRVDYSQLSHPSVCILAGEMDVGDQLGLKKAWIEKWIGVNRTKLKFVYASTESPFITNLCLQSPPALPRGRLQTQELAQKVLYFQY